MKKAAILTFIILFSLALRLFFLDRIPNAISGDELTYVFTAKSVQLIGTDISGTWRPWQGFLFQYPKGEHQAELPYFIVLPFISIFGNSLFWIRFPYALMGTLVVLLTYLLTKRLFGERTGLVAGLFAAINPWFLFMSRTVYEMIPATLFYLASLYFILDRDKKRIYLSIPFLILAFYSYIGTKLIFLPFILIATWYAVFSSKEKRLTKPYLAVILTGIVLASLFVVMQIGSQNTRITELFLPNDSSIIKAVDATRKATIQNPMLSLFINKATLYVWTLIGKTFSVISPSYLFFEGDLFFSLWHGFLYPIDLVFVVIGSIIIISKKKPFGIFFFSLLAIAILPQVFHKNQGNFSSHTTLFIPLLIIISSYGCVQFVLLFRSILYRRITAMLLLLFYGAFFANFFHTYFFRSPLGVNTEFDIRTLSHYLKLANTNADIILITSNPYDILKKYLFYTDSLQKDTAYELQQNIINKNYSVDRITFLPCESSVPESDTPKTVIVYSGCLEQSPTDPYINIARLHDGGVQYKIYNDQICSQFKLKPFPFGITLKDFEIESMTPEHFCETFITKYE